MKKPLLLLILAISTSFVFSQAQTDKRISIANPNTKALKIIKETGIDLSCGAQYDSNNNLILELSSDEINLLDIKEISYSVLIEDLTKYTIERAEKYLPIAKKELEELKIKSKANKEKNAQNSSKSLSFDSVTIDNILQYDGCDEIDWSANVPLNYNLGSMAGCLTYSEMLAELDQMRALYPSLITVKTDASPTSQITHGNSYTAGGTYNTWAGNTIYYVKISDNPDVDENEPEALYTGMTHSREVSSMMNLIYFMWYVLENYATDSNVKNLVDNRELYFIPVANPDGLLWNEERSPGGGGLQRKNLNPSANTGNHVLRGVDLNRNYDYLWGPNAIYGGSSGSTSSNVYRGTSGFSEPETQIIRDFSETRDFKTALNHHASSNLLPHGYNGYPAAAPSGREDQYAKFCHDLTRYNRYIYGAAPDILTIANGDMSDWMFGGASDVNGSQGYLDTVGATEGILALAPENGSWQDSNEGFWPTPTKITEIAQRALRMNFVSGFMAGKFAQLHDFTTTDINTLTGNLDFGIEFTGQTLGDFTLTVTPVSANIVSITSPSTEVGMAKLEQRAVSATYTLNASIQPNDLIEYQVTLANEDNTIYQANVIKHYLPTVAFQDNPDVDGTTNWVTSGGTWGTTTDGFNGTTGITDSPAGSYGNNQSKRIRLDRTFDFTSYEKVVVQFNAKWALERNFDYVQLQGSINGSTWTDLCGKYTKPGSDIGGNRYDSSNSADGGATKSTSDQNNQPTGELVYEGHGMDKWVMEEIFIDLSNNSTLFNQNSVEFRFVFDTDSNNRADGYGENFDPFDGFTFDDFKVIGIQIACDDTNSPTSIAVSGITTTTANVTWDAIPSATYDLRYREIGAPSWTTVTDIATNNYTIAGLNDSINHEVQVNTRCTSTTSAFSSSVNFTTATPVACTGSVVNAFPYAESFESGLGLWSQDVSDDIDWVRNSGGTPSNTTGPSGAADGTWYMYTEASVADNGSPNKTAYLISPCIEFDGFENAQITFDYHMYGADMGTLSLEVSIDDGANYSNVFSISGEQHGSNGAAWTNQIVDLSVYDGQTIKLRFYGLTGSSWRGDMAFDNINITADTVVLSTSEFDINEWSIYPNPSSIGMINIKAPNDIQKFDILISNTLGQQVYQEKVVLSNNTHIINTGNLNTGVYFITLKTNEGKSTKKIIIQ